MRHLIPFKLSNRYIIIILLLLINTSCEKCNETISWRTEISSNSWSYANGGPDTVNFKVYLYRTEEDYISDQNRIIPPFNGDVYQVTDNSETFYWVRIKQDSLNNLRSNQICTDSNKCGMMLGGYGDLGGCDEYKIKHLKARLSTTPTRLQLNIKNNGIAVEGAIVQLFYTQDDYNKGTKPLYSITWNKYTERNYYGANDGIFADTTDKEGIAYFNNLEPRDYWFKVTKGNLNNSLTTIKTLKSLPDDPNITTLLDIGIK